MPCDLNIQLSLADFGPSVRWDVAGDEARATHNSRWMLDLCYPRSRITLVNKFAAISL
jgi:hypothetical protein